MNMNIIENRRRKEKHVKETKEDAIRIKFKHRKGIQN